MKVLIVFILIIAGITMVMFQLLKGLKQFIFPQQSRGGNSSYRNYRKNTNNSQAYNKEHHKKIFGKNEGEYVKYEEIKE